MVDLERTLRMLTDKREELLDQLDAVDKAIAALWGANKPEATVDQAEPEAPEIPSTTVIPTKVKPKRVLSDEHKQAMTEGRRKAREAKDAAAGRARETLDDSFVPALAATGVDAPPRLVKRQR